MSQGGGGAGAGAGGAVGGGGGGSKVWEVLKNVGLPVGLGVLASGSPLAAVGVRTGLGAWDMFSQQRRQKKLSELMAEYYGGEAGSRVETPSNAGDPAFGGEPGKFSLGTDMMFKEGRETPSALGLGGGGRGLPETFGVPEPSMTAGAELSPNKISTLLSKKAAPAEKGPMGRDEFFARMAASGGMTPMQIEALKAREEAQETSETRYQEGRATDEERYAETKAYRASTEARAERTAERADRAAERADRSLELQEDAATRAERADARNAANMAEDNARSQRAAEMAEERFEIWKAAQEEGKQLDVTETARLLDTVNSTLGDLELQAKFADEGQMVAIEEKLTSFRAMQSTLMSAFESGVTGAAPGRRRRFNAAGEEIQ